jgi:adenylosuccinate synthase
MRAYAVIGAGFGDEGKGLITDHLVRKTGAEIVARYNGGGQASHTVMTPDGQRHVFSHVGAGTFAGASTYLSSRFIVNPYILDIEMAELRKHGSRPKVMVSPEAPVTTIFDMALNAAAELARGEQAHGSCGIGINETVTRNLAGFMLTVEDVRNKSRSWLEEALQVIHREWVPQRLKTLGIGGSTDDLPTSFHLKTGEALKNDNYEEHAVRMLMGVSHLSIETPYELWRNGRKPFILEGAQGLALDEELGTFPHITRSLTGLVWALELANDFNYDEIVPVYVTRAYATRHGAGPLPHDGEFISFGNRVGDSTNLKNEWQGAIRFAPLDLSLMKQNIEADLHRASKQLEELGASRRTKIAAPVLVITCMDQLDRHVHIYDVNNRMVTVNSHDLPRVVEEQVGILVTMISRGPRSTDVVHLSDFDV